MFISSLKEGKLSAEYLLGSMATNIHLLIHIKSRDYYSFPFKKAHLLVETRTEISDDPGPGI